MFTAWNRKCELTLRGELERCFLGWVGSIFCIHVVVVEAILKRSINLRQPNQPTSQPANEQTRHAIFIFEF